MCNTIKKTAEEKAFSPQDALLLDTEAALHTPNPRAYGIRIAIYSGLRAGELPCLRWSDITNGYIHVHHQQKLIVIDGKRKGFEEINTTKDEKGISHGGRVIPILPELDAILKEIRNYQETHGIQSEFVLYDPKTHGWITKTSYERYLRRICNRLGLSLSNNHAFRIGFNSNVLIPAGLDVRERALILGHSIETNERNYSYAGSHLLEGISRKLASAKPYQSPGLEEPAAMPLKGAPDDELHNAGSQPLVNHC